VSQKQVDIVVSMTSWKKRIEYVSISILSLLKNTITPRSIELNLSEEEFPNKEDELPKDLIELTKIYPININWVGKNTKSFKKLIPTLQKYWDEKELYIFTADDDVVYEYDMLEKYVGISEKLPEACICFGKFSGALCDQPVVKGGATLYKVRFFNENVWKQLTDTIINTNEDDWWYAFHFLTTGKRSIVYTDDELTFFNQIEGHEYNTSETHKMYLNMLRQPVVNVIKDKEKV
jgi:hypothetical protein